MGPAHRPADERHLGSCPGVRQDQERGAGGRRGEAEVRRSGGRGGERDPEQPGRDEQEEGEGVGHLLVQQDWGSSLDVALRAHIVAEIEKKYKVKLEGNSKALNKLGIAVEKVKKQMSANSNKLPMQIDSLVDDVDVNISVDRATFEQLACEQLEEVRTCLLSLLQATTVRREQLHSVELVGGAGRMPAIKQIVQEVFGIAPTSSLNADEAVSKAAVSRLRARVTVVQAPRQAVRVAAPRPIAPRPRPGVIAPSRRVATSTSGLSDVFGNGETSVKFATPQFQFEF